MDKTAHSKKSKKKINKKRKVKEWIGQRNKKERKGMN